MTRNHICTVHAEALRSGRVIRRHTLRDAALTALGSGLGSLPTGALFPWLGLGG